MALPLLKDGDHDSVRAAIDIELDEVSLPSRIINLPIYAGAAEADVLLADPLALTRTGDEAARVKRAVIYFTASYLALALPRYLKEAFGQHYAFTKQAVDRQELAEALRARAEAELDYMTDPGVLDEDRPTMFSVSHGSRESLTRLPNFQVPGVFNGIS